MTSIDTQRLPWEFNGVVRLTRVGTTYIVTTVVIAIAAINTGNNSLYIAVSFMLACLLLSGIASKSGLKHLSIEIREVGEAWAGVRATGTLRVRNRSRIWNVRDVVLMSNAFAAPVVLPLINRGEETLVSVDFQFPRRGMAHVAAIDSYTRYPFGFFLKKRRLRVDSEVVVYPRLAEADSIRERFRSMAGEENSARRRGPGTDVHSFRDYAHGDSLRHVHWKKTASTGRWIVRQTEEDAARSVHVIVDTYKPEGAGEEDLEDLISAAAAFLYGSAQRGFDVTLTLPRASVHIRESESPAPLFHALALVEPETRATFSRDDDPDAIVFSLTGGKP